MKQLKLIFLCLFSLQTFIHAAETKYKKKLSYTNAFCILIIYQTKAIQYQHYKPTGAIESLLLGEEVRDDEFRAELPNHNFARLRQYIPSLYQSRIQYVQNFGNLPPEIQAMVCKNILDRVPKMRQYLDLSETFVWQPSDIEYWEEMCSPKLLEALKSQHLSEKKPDLPLPQSWTYREPKTNNRPRCTVVNIPKEQDTQKPSGYGCCMM